MPYLIDKHIYTLNFTHTHSLYNTNSLYHTKLHTNSLYHNTPHFLFYLNVHSTKNRFFVTNEANLILGLWLHNIDNYFSHSDLDRN